jgi:hypothetical protein
MFRFGKGPGSQRIDQLHDILTYVSAMCGENASLVDTSLFNDNLATISGDTSALAVGLSHS